MQICHNLREDDQSVWKKQRGEIEASFSLEWCHHSTMRTIAECSSKEAIVDLKNRVIVRSALTSPDLPLSMIQCTNWIPVATRTIHGRLEECNLNSRLSLPVYHLLVHIYNCVCGNDGFVRLIILLIGVKLLSAMNPELYPCDQQRRIWRRPAQWGILIWLQPATQPENRDLWSEVPFHLTGTPDLHFKRIMPGCTLQ